MRFYLKNFFLDYIIECIMSNAERHYHIVTYGCQMNVHDSERIAGMLSELGYTQIDDIGLADIVVFNTCCIRENAENHAYGNIGMLKKLKAARRDMIIAVGGCMPQQIGKADVLHKKFPYVDIIFGTHNLGKLKDYIELKQGRKKAVIEIQESEGAVTEDDRPLRTSYPNAWINIMYGCNNFCRYCIVPYVRGRERSRTPEDILAEVRRLAADGVKEVMLLGQNVNSYGKNLETPVSFAELLRMVNEVEGIERIRFMTSHPKDLSDELIQAMADCDKVCKYLHLPVQSGSDEILRRMNRHYTKESYMELVRKARAAMPDITLSTDIIVGFPGETEEDFQGTLELVKKVGYMQLFTFIYSKRTGTKAAEMPDPTPRAEKTDRMTRLLKVQDEIAMNLVRQQVGQTVRVLVEGYGRSDGTLSGRLDNNLTVEFAADPALMGSYAQVHLTGARATVLLGELET